MDMDASSTVAACDYVEATGTASGLAALAGINFGSLVPTEILAMATGGAATLAPCHVEASYRAGDKGMELCPPSQAKRPELAESLQRSRWNGQIELSQQ